MNIEHIYNNLIYKFMSDFEFHDLYKQANF